MLFPFEPDITKQLDKIWEGTDDAAIIEIRIQVGGGIDSGMLFAIGDLCGSDDTVEFSSSRPLDRRYAYGSQTVSIAGLTDSHFMLRGGRDFIEKVIMLLKLQSYCPVLLSYKLGEL